MNFLKQAQDFAASGNTNTDGDSSAAPGASDGGFGSFMNSASSMLKSQGGAATGDGSGAAPTDGSLPGGRTAPTNQELMQSGKVLLGAAQGQQVDSSQLAGAASDVLGGLAAHGNLDQGTYGTYITQAEDYLNKYSGQGTAGGQSGAGAGAGAAAGAGAGAGAGARSSTAKLGSQDPADSQAPTSNDMSDAPTSQADQSGGSFQSSDQTAYSGSATGNDPSSDSYASGQQQGSDPSSDSGYGNNQY